MPRYRSRSRTRKLREKKRIRAQVPRDRRKLSHWAVRGTHKDYEKLRQHALDKESAKPSYVTDGAMDLFKNASRRKLIEAAHEPENHWFTDGLAFLLDKVPSGIGFNWMKNLGQVALKPFRGDHLSEVDEQFARLIEESYYRDDRPETFEGWTRQKDFDSNYVTVYDNEDGHRFVSVRGTKFNVQDLAQDAIITYSGKPQDLISKELRKVLDHTEPGRTVDVGAHSLGGSLVLTAFDNDSTLQDRVHQTYLYNPAMSPFTNKNVTQKYESDDRVRYFIDLLDPVSVGDLGEKGPSNVVYRTSYTNPFKSHNLMKWGNTDGLAKHDQHDDDEKEPVIHKKRAELPYDRDGDGVPDAPEPKRMDPEFTLDFGNEFDSGAWNVYWKGEQ